MNTARPRAILFASTPPARLTALLAHLRRRWPDHDWTVCVKARERGWLPPECASVVTLPRWRPGVTAARRVRGGNFDVSVVCWTGEKGYARLKVLHLLTPARERHVYNENVDSFELRRGEPDPPWRRHLRWRRAQHRPGGPGVAATLRGAYAGTLGPVLGAGLVLVRHALWHLGLGPRGRPWR